MKKTTLWATLFACALALLAGCTKEIQDPVDNEPAGNETQPTVTRIGLTTEGYGGETRTSVKDNTVTWVNGDLVQLYSTEKTYAVSVNGGEAYINVTDLNQYSTIYAAYPLGVFYDINANMTFPSSYASTIDDSGRQVIALPMMAYVAENSLEHPATSLEFKHQTAAVKVMLWNATATPLTVTRVVVKSDQYKLNGYLDLLLYHYNTDPTHEYAPADATSDSEKQVEVTFPGYGQSGALVIPAGDQTKSVQVPFRPIGAGDMTIEIYLTDGTKRYVYSYTATNPELKRNQMMTAKAKLDLNGNMRLDVVDLSALDPSTFPTDANSTPYYTVSDGDILTGTFPGNCDLCIPDGATVTLAGVTHHAGQYISGIKCLGSATIILAPGTVNDLTRGDDSAFYGIGMTKYGACTLTIEGSGTLNASGGLYAGIGGNSASHHIVINGGNITATGGSHAAGIGARNSGKCGNITINGGTVNATGGQYATGIGCGFRDSRCGDITFAGGTVTVTNGGVGDRGGSGNRCGNVYFSGGTVTVWGGISLVISSGASSIYVDGEDVGPSIETSPYYFPAQ